MLPYITVTHQGEVRYNDETTLTSYQTSCRKALSKNLKLALKSKIFQNV